MKRAGQSGEISRTRCTPFCPVMCLFVHISAFALFQSNKNCSMIRLGGVSGGPSGGCGLVRTEQDLRLSVSCAPSTVEQVHSCERLRLPREISFRGLRVIWGWHLGCCLRGGWGRRWRGHPRHQHDNYEQGWFNPFLLFVQPSSSSPSWCCFDKLRASSTLSFVSEQKVLLFPEKKWPSLFDLLPV